MRWLVAADLFRGRSPPDVKVLGANSRGRLTQRDGTERIFGFTAVAADRGGAWI